MTPAEDGCICVNGRFHGPAHATVSALDAGFLLGDGLFESMRAIDGVPYLLDRHLLRLYGAAAALEFVNMPPLELMSEQVHLTLQKCALADSYVRITVTRGAGGLGLDQPVAPPTVVIAALPAPPRDERTLDAVLLARRHPTPTAKSTSWQHALRDRREVDRRGADEGIYVSNAGRVLESVTSNVFVVKDERLVTPPTTDCLPGITRARVLELARDAGMPAEERAIELEELFEADEVFLTNAVRGVRRVRAVQGVVIGAPDGAGSFERIRDLQEQDRRAAVAELR